MSNYTVKPGDTLSKISLIKYGSEKYWKNILEVNPQILNRKKDVDGIPIIYPGDEILVPNIIAKMLNLAQPELVEPKLGILSKNIDINSMDQNFNFYINGKLFDLITGCTLKMSVDSLDVFSIEAPWEDNNEFTDIFSPFAYSEIAFYYKRKLLFLGRLLTSAPDISADKKIINLQGYPLCGFLNDCTLPQSKFPPSFNNLKLEDIAKKICEPFGISVIFSEDSGDKFDKVEYEIGTKLLDFLKKLAEQRNFIFTNNTFGNLVFWKVPVESGNVIFKEGDQNFISCKVNFKPQEMYSHITVYTKCSKAARALNYTYENKLLTRKNIFRPFSYVAEDANLSNIKKIAMAKAGQMFINCCSYELKVIGCEDKRGFIYRKGMTVSIYAPSAMIYRETEFQVQEIEIKCSESEGVQTTFKLMLPDSISGIIPEKLPWEKD